MNRQAQWELQKVVIQLQEELFHRYKAYSIIQIGYIAPPDVDEKKVRRKGHLEFAASVGFYLICGSAANLLHTFQV